MTDTANRPPLWGQVGALATMFASSRRASPPTGTRPDRDRRCRMVPAGRWGEEERRTIAEGGMLTCSSLLMKPEDKNSINHRVTESTAERQKAERRVQIDSVFLCVCLFSVLSVTLWLNLF